MFNIIKRALSIFYKKNTASTVCYNKKDKMTVISYPSNKKNRERNRILAQDSCRNIIPSKKRKTEFTTEPNGHANGVSIKFDVTIPEHVKRKRNAKNS